MIDDRDDDEDLDPRERRRRMIASATYAVGYGKTPVHTRFPVGVSGNPKGKRRGSRGLRSELQDELNERVSVTIDGKTKKFSKRRLIIKALAAKAAKGDVRAADRLLHLTIQAEGFEDQRPSKQRLSDADLQILELFLGGDSLKSWEAGADDE